MISRLLSIAIFCAGLFCIAQAQVPMTGAGKGAPGGAAGYSGPGDIVSGATVFYSCTRAYSNAWAAGTGKLCNVIRTSDTHTCDILSATSGDIGLTANCSTGGDNGSTAASFCNATTCTILVVYDQSGNGTDANVVTFSPVFTLSCFGSLPCIVPASLHGFGLVSTATINVTQPFTHSLVTERDNLFTTFASPIGCNAGATQSGFDQSSGHALIFAGSVVSVTGATDSVNHAMQYVYNGASSSVKVDDAAPVGSLNPGAADCSGGVVVNFATAGNRLDGKIGEGAMWPSGLSSGNQTSLCHNQSAYYSLGLSC